MEIFAVYNPLAGNGDPYYVTTVFDTDGIPLSDSFDPLYDVFDTEDEARAAVSLLECSRYGVGA